MDNWQPIETLTTPRNGQKIIGGWFAGDPCDWPLESEKKLIWAGGWKWGRQPGFYTPTHWKPNCNRG